ncbi:hypothetical protein SDC9_160326 [bioreactor metagenome]|uniref:Uncharacterized protein n=1 Tax=bioreactor metagenome TaxID=1076179 RepID=A0A645FH87_9ZZZZ
MPCGNHDIRQVVERVQMPHIHGEYARLGGEELNLAFLNIPAVHMRALAKRGQPPGGLILMQGVFVHLPNIEVVLAHREQHGDILLGDDMSFAELRVLGLPGNNAREVMAEYVSRGILGVDELHSNIIPLFFQKNNGISSDPCFFKRKFTFRENCNAFLMKKSGARPHETVKKRVF